jgi:flagellar protein FlaG
MAMTYDLRVYSQPPVEPVSAKKQPEPIRTLKIKDIAQDSSGDGGLFSALSQDKQAEKGGLEQTVHDLNSLVQDLQRELRFSLHAESGEMVVQVLDGKTEDVIRQIPSEEVLQLRERLEQATGAIFKDRA